MGRQAGESRCGDVEVYTTISLFGKLYFLVCTSVFLRACKVYFSDDGLVGSG